MRPCVGATCPRRLAGLRASGGTTRARSRATTCPPRPASGAALRRTTAAPRASGIRAPGAAPLPVVAQRASREVAALPALQLCTAVGPESHPHSPPLPQVLHHQACGPLRPLPGRAVGAVRHPRVSGYRPHVACGPLLALAVRRRHRRHRDWRLCCSACCRPRRCAPTRQRPRRSPAHVPPAQQLMQPVRAQSRSSAGGAALSCR